MLALLLAGCMLGPDYRRPDLVMPAQVQRGELRTAARGHRPPTPRGGKQFGDPATRCADREGLRNNQDLVAAAARVERFYGTLGTTRSQLFPQVGAGAPAAARAPASDHHAGRRHQPLRRDADQPARELGDRSLRPHAPAHRGGDGRAAGERVLPARHGAVGGGGDHDRAMCVFANRIANGGRLRDAGAAQGHVEPVRTAPPGRRGVGRRGQPGAIGIRRPRCATIPALDQAITQPGERAVACCWDAIRGRSHAAGRRAVARCPSCRPACRPICWSGAPTCGRRSRCWWRPMRASARPRPRTSRPSALTGAFGQASRSLSDLWDGAGARLELRCGHQRADLHGGRRSPARC